MKTSTKLIIFFSVSAFLIGYKIAHVPNKTWNQEAYQTLGDKK